MPAKLHTIVDSEDRKLNLFFPSIDARNIFQVIKIRFDNFFSKYLSCELIRL